jgi:hypothetical protein
VTFRPKVQAIITGTSPAVTCFDMFYDGSTVPPAAPHLMNWNKLTSRWDELLVTSAIVTGSYVRVTLSAGAAVAVGDWISPMTERKVTVAEEIEAYFDGLGPGELIDLDTDPRADRAFRFPEPSEEWPEEASAGIIATMISELAPAVSGGELLEFNTAASRVVPAIPASPTLGPYLVVPSYVGIYPV